MHKNNRTKKQGGKVVHNATPAGLTNSVCTLGGCGRPAFRDVVDIWRVETPERITTRSCDNSETQERS